MTGKKKWKDKSIKEKRFIAILCLIIVISNTWLAATHRIDSRRLRGVFYFIDDMVEAETIIVYDSVHNEVTGYVNDEINNLISEDTFKKPWPKYKREFNKHLGELKYIVEVIFSEDRNTPKFKDSTIETLTVYSVETESFEEQSTYERYVITIGGQDCVVILRNIVLEKANTGG